MRILSVLLAVTLTVGMVAAVVFFSVSPSPESATAQPDAALTKEADAASTTSAAILRAQIAQLQQAIDARQTVYGRQLAVLASAQGAVDQRLAELDEQATLLHEQVDALSAERASRIAQYDGQLQQLQVQYALRAAEITARIDEAQARLAEANQLLGR